MSFYFNKKFTNALSFDEVKEKTIDALQKEGFGVLTHINIKDTFKNKLDVEFRRYEILGACNPNFAYEALTEEPKVGLFLPCNVTVEELSSGEIEVSVVDPIAMMSPIDNKTLLEFAKEVQLKLKNVFLNID